MSDDPSLFGDDEPNEPVAMVPQERSISDWQVGLLRKALDARGLTTMLDRQTVIAIAAGRPVESLRVLSYDEAMRVLTQLGQAPASGRTTTESPWV